MENTQDKFFFKHLYSSCIKIELDSLIVKIIYYAFNFVTIFFSRDILCITHIKNW